MKSNHLAIMIVDDHPMIRSALESMFKPLPYIREIHKASDGFLAIKHLTHVKIDVVLLDISMPNMNGIQCIKEIKQGWPETIVIILTQFSDGQYFETLMNMGAEGYLLKSTTEAELISAFHQIVFEQKPFVSESVAQISHAENATNDVLGEREVQILILICHGLKSHEISTNLNISIHTVHNHRKAILKKTNSPSTPALIQWAKDNKIVSF